jgi:hypothetical protein
MSASRSKQQVLETAQQDPEPIHMASAQLDHDCRAYLHSFADTLCGSTAASAAVFCERQLQPAMLCGLHCMICTGCYCTRHSSKLVPAEPTCRYPAQDAPSHPSPQSLLGASALGCTA